MVESCACACVCSNEITCKWFHLQWRMMCNLAGRERWCRCISPLCIRQTTKSADLSTNCQQLPTESTKTDRFEPRERKKERSSIGAGVQWEKVLRESWSTCCHPKIAVEWLPFTRHSTTLYAHIDTFKHWHKDISLCLSFIHCTILRWRVLLLVMMMMMAVLFNYFVRYTQNNELNSGRRRR